MKNTRYGFLTACLFLMAAVLVFCPGAVRANAVTFECHTWISGAVPAFAATEDAPWIRATFEDVGVNQVLLTMEAVNLTAPEKISSWDFNLNPDMNPAALTIAYQSGAQATKAYKGVNVTWATDPAKGFDIGFLYNTTTQAKLFGPGLESVYLITGAGIVAESFEFKSAPANGTDAFYMVANIKGIGGAGSGLVHGDQEIQGDSVTSVVPEPISLLLLGLGLAGFSVVRSRTTRKEQK